jgi:hypothetical protein
MQNRRKEERKKKEKKKKNKLGQSCAKLRSSWG